MKEWGVGSGGGCGWRGGGGEEGIGVGVTGYLVAELKNHAQSHMQSFSQARPQTELNLPPPPHLSKDKGAYVLSTSSGWRLPSPSCPLPAPSLTLSVLPPTVLHKLHQVLASCTQTARMSGPMQTPRLLRTTPAQKLLTSALGRRNNRSLWPPQSRGGGSVAAGTVGQSRGLGPSQKHSEHRGVIPPSPCSGLAQHRPRAPRVTGSSWANLGQTS